MAETTGGYPHQAEVLIEWWGSDERGRRVIEDALDLLIDRMDEHPAVSDPGFSLTFAPSEPSPAPDETGGAS